MTFESAGQRGQSLPCHGGETTEVDIGELSVLRRLHHIHRPLEEERAAESQDSAIWVSDAGNILMG